MKFKNKLDKLKTSQNKNEEVVKDYSAHFFVDIISGLTVLFFGDALSYIDKRDWLSFSIRLILSIILFVFLNRFGLKVYQKIFEGCNT